MSFNFNPPASSAPASNTQGTPGTTAPAGGSLFGAATGGAPSFSFGGLPGASKPPATGGSLFGTPPATGTPGGGLFGNSTTATTAAANIFGNTATTKPSGTPTTAATTGGSLFGNLGGGAAGGSLFGKPANTGGATNIFGGGAAAAATPSSQASGQPAVSGAAQPAPAPIFGSTSSSSLFPGTGNVSAATPAKSLFALPSTTPAGAPRADGAKPAAPLFGSGTTPSPFGASLSGGPTIGAAPQQPAAPAASAPGMFGGSTTGPSLFGQKPAGAAPAASPFGAGATKPGATQAAPTQAPAAGLFAPKAPAGATAGASGAAPLSGILGGVTSAPPATSAPSMPALFGNKSATPATAPSIKPATTAQTPSLFAPSTASKPTGSLFGVTSTAAPAPAATSAAPAISLTTPSSTAPTTTSAPGGSVFGAKPSAPSLAGTNPTNGTTAAQNGTTAPATLGASTSGPASQLPRLKNKSMDDIVTRWAGDLSKYQKEFKEQATKVAEWDRLLVDNGASVQKLYLATYDAERASNEIEKQLLAVESQQNELENWLERHEADVEEMLTRQMGQTEQLGGPDQERERTYKTAEKLSQYLDEKSRDLSKMVKEINDISATLSKTSRPEDPVSQIVRVLNGHLAQIQWIDTNAAELQAKVTAAQKASSGLGNQPGVSDNDAVETFYRSYMGRR